jgi:beta-N-acetylhexosaminidase
MPDSLLRSLSLRQKVGQLVFPWLLGNYSALDGEGLDTILVAIDSLAIGGIIVSTGTPIDAAAKLNALQRRSALPLLIAADLEFGTGMRLQGGTAFPQPMAVGATGRELDAYEMGRVTALEARAVGIHVTFSPVADVNNNPANPIINTRSFGEDPAAVSRLVAAYVRGATEHGLSTTAKHFPGHGDTGIDSHIALPLTTGCWDRLDTLELEPFRAAIRAGVTAVMTAHVAVPCLDAEGGRPATLSRRIMSEVLRDSLGFTGIVVTDALTMGAIVAQYGAGESAVLAFEAGSDLLLMPSDLRAAVEAMVTAVESGRISMDRLDRSVRRLVELKAALGLFDRRTVPLDSVPEVVGRRAFQQIADDIAARGLTLVTRGPIDGFRARRGRTAVITYADETNLSIGGELLRGLRAAGDTASTFRLYPASGPASYDSARAVIAAVPRVIFAAGVRPIAWRGHVALPDSLAALILSTSASRPSLLVSFGSPYLLSQLPGFTGGYLLAWSDVLATERAVARALSGPAAITGLLPISLGPGYPRGSGIMVGGTGSGRE